MHALVQHLSLTFSLALVLSASLLAGCSGGRSNGGEHETSAYEVGHLNAVLQPGVSREVVLKEFGRPLDEIESESGASCLTYISFTPARDLKPDQLTGFQVILNNDLVVRWMPVLTASGKDGAATTSGSGPDAQLPNETSTVHGARLQFFLVTEDQADGRRRFHTETFPHLGFISETPELEISKLKTVKRHNRKTSDGASQIVVELRETDARVLQKLSEANLGKRLLIVVGDSPVLAPFIHSALNTPELILTVPQTANDDAIYRTLSELAEN
jgi:hypothetical protein